MLLVLGLHECACGHPPVKNQSDGKSRSAGLQHDSALIGSQNPVPAKTSNYPFYIGR